MITTQEIIGDIWDKWKEGFWIVIPTNGFVNNKGECTMGAGLALQAKTKFPDLPKELAERLEEYGNVVFTFHKYHLITFPVKRVWWERANPELIKRSCKDLQKIFEHNLSGIPLPLYLPRVGCGNGKLKWTDVKPILEKYLDERFVVCDNGQNRA